MYGHSESFTLFAFVAFVLLICWLAFSSLEQGGQNPEVAVENVMPSLDDLVVGDAVVVIGKAAGDFDRVVRPVTAADRNYLWVDGHRYRRSDGRQADVQWFETEVSRIKVEPEWAE